MSQTSPPTGHELVCSTAADVVAHWGAIPLHRICMDPLPGAACEEDLIQWHDQKNRLFELVDKTLVEKDMGTYEAFLASRLVFYLGVFVDPKSLGIILGADGMVRLKPGLVRIPDVSFISKERMQGVDLAAQPIANVIPDLVAEVVSRGNAGLEMDRKLVDYFDLGVRLVWYIYPETKSAAAYTSSSVRRVVPNSGSLDGGDVLPGFMLKLETLFQV